MKHKSLLTVLIVLLVGTGFCLFLYHFDNKYTQKAPQAIAGTLFVSSEDWSQYPIRYLWNGWNFYPDVLLTPETYESRDPDSAVPVQIGAYHNFAFGNASADPHGCGTYTMTLLLPETPHTYTIELPEVFSAYRFYIGNTLMAEMGDPDAQDYKEMLRSRAITFRASGTVRLLLTVRDQSYFYSGLIYPPAFGETTVVNTRRVMRICLTVSIVTVILVLAALALWLQFSAAKRARNAGIFFMLCLCAATTMSYSLVHGVFPTTIQPWYTVELVSGYVVTLLILLLHNRVCSVSSGMQVGSIAAAGAVCVLTLLYSASAAHVTQRIIAAYSMLAFGFKLMITLYLLGTALYALHRQIRTEALFYADLFYAAVFLWACFLPNYEPILGKWFPEWGCLVLIVMLGITFWRNVAQGYLNSLLNAEEHRQILRQLQMQKAHFAQISAHVEESRRQRHDFRQHLRTIASLSGDPEAQQDYIRQIALLNETSRPETYCHNPAVDALLYHYASTARMQDVPLSIRVELPDDLPLDSVAMCTILGNLLENALEACERQQTGERFIRLHIRWQFQKIYLMLENSYNGELDSRHGVFYSLKHSGKGIGTASVRTMTQRLGGSVTFRAEACSFRVQLILPPAPSAEKRER